MAAFSTHMPTITPESRVILVQNLDTDPQNTLKNQVLAFFQQAGIPIEPIILDSRTAEVSKPKGPKPQLILVLGGDGTFLKTVRCFGRDNIPLAGINTGHLGFLTRIESSKLDECLSAILSGDVSIEQRWMLEIPQHNELALNDVVVKNSQPTRLAKLQVWVDDELLADYDADGLIVSTPTGSTAYNLSAGGPILDPETQVVAITPICSHSLAAKPIVLPAHRRLTIHSDESNLTPLVCAMDADDVFELAPGESFTVAQSFTRLPLIRFQHAHESFYGLLKRKLAWNANPRKR